MDFITGIFEYNFLRNAFLAAVLAGITCGIIGTYIVSRRLVFLSGGITHASFGGIGIAYWMGANPIVGALIFAVISALGVEWASIRGKIRQDSAVGIIWSVGMAIGIIFLYLTPGYIPNLMSFLFGNILTTTNTDIVSLAALAGVMILLACFFLRTVMYVAFDGEFARTRGVPVNTIYYIMAIFIALTLVFSIRVAGIMLLISLLSIPPVIANSFTNSYFGITLWSCVIAVIGNILGLWASYAFDVPAGAATIIVFVLTLIIVKLLPLRKKKIALSE